LPLLDSQSAFWSLFKRRQRHQRKDVSINSVLTATATVATERNYGNGTTERQRQNGNGRTATEGWKPGITTWETVRPATAAKDIAMVR